MAPASGIACTAEAGGPGGPPADADAGAGAGAGAVSIPNRAAYVWSGLAPPSSCVRKLTELSIVLSNVSSAESLRRLAAACDPSSRDWYAFTTWDGGRHG